MILAIISDTHNIVKQPNILKKIKEVIKNTDALIFLGDYVSDISYIIEDYKGILYAVKGNGDFNSKYPSEQVLEILNKRIFICHGDKYGVSYGLNNLYYRAKELEANIVLYGHTHISSVDREENILFFNPGSSCFPRGVSKKSIGIMDIDKEGKVNPYIKEL